MTDAYTRRELLAGVGGMSAAGISGCISFGNSRFRLSAYRLDDPYERFLMADPTTQRAQFAIDYPDEYKRSVYEELIDRGSVTVLNYELAYRYDFGSERRERPQFITREGDYYRVHVDEVREVEREWWEFYLDLQNAEPSAESEPATLPITSLSELDRRILERAMEAAAADRDPAIDVGDNAPGSRGVLYHDHLDADASELVPSPPFEYLRHNEHLFWVRAERETVPVTERTFGAERVATSQAEYERYVNGTLLDADFSERSLSDDARDVIETAVDGPFYEEKPPMSDALEAVLTHLGAVEHVGAHGEYDDYTTFPNMYAAYRGTWYEFDLTIYP